jgi:hypothetical protein
MAGSHLNGGTPDSQQISTSCIFYVWLLTFQYRAHFGFGGFE